jgi:hypothetical protein
MYACAWKSYANVYSLQVNEVKQSDKSELKKLFKEWKQSATGWNMKNGDQFLVYNKEFEDQKEWLKWAKTCPIKLFEIKVKRDKEEKVQLTCKNKKKRGK